MRSSAFSSLGYFSLVALLISLFSPVHAQYPDPTWPWPTSKEIQLVPTTSGMYTLTSDAPAQTGATALLQGTGVYNPAKLPQTHITYDFKTPVMLSRTQLVLGTASATSLTLRIEGGTISINNNPVINQLLFFNRSNVNVNDNSVINIDFPSNTIVQFLRINTVNSTPLQLIKWNAITVWAKATTFVPAIPSSHFQVTSSNGISDTGVSNLLYGEGGWNSGGWAPSAGVHVTFDFSMPTRVDQINLKVIQTPSELSSVHHAIYGTNVYNPYTPFVGSFTLLQDLNIMTTHNQSIIVPLPSGTTYRFFRISSYSSPSYISWEKIAFYSARPSPDKYFPILYGSQVFNFLRQSQVPLLPLNNADILDSSFIAYGGGGGGGYLFNSGAGGSGAQVSGNISVSSIMLNSIVTVGEMGGNSIASSASGGYGGGSVFSDGGNGGSKSNVGTSVSGGGGGGATYISNPGKYFFFAGGGGGGGSNCNNGLLGGRGGSAGNSANSGEMGALPPIGVGGSGGVGGSPAGSHNGYMSGGGGGGGGANGGGGGGGGCDGYYGGAGGGGAGTTINYNLTAYSTQNMLNYAAMPGQLLLTLWYNSILIQAVGNPPEISRFSNNGNIKVTVINALGNKVVNVPLMLTILSPDVTFSDGSRQYTTNLVLNAPDGLTYVSRNILANTPTDFEFTCLIQTPTGKNGADNAYVYTTVQFFVW